MATAKAPEALALVRAYHARTMHDFRRYARGPMGLDWATQPNPFRRYVGADVIKLAHTPHDKGPLYSDVFGGGGGGGGARAIPPAPLNHANLSRLFEDSLALSAWKQYGESRWPLRVNPSSGNLHPTEAHVVLPEVPGLCDTGVLAHYTPQVHALEVRARDIPRLHLRESEFLVAITSIHWREAWKFVPPLAVAADALSRVESNVSWTALIAPCACVK
jgi:hypothetical protein